MGQHFIVRNGFLLAAGEIFHSHLRPFVPEDNGKARAGLLSQPELSRDFCGRQRIINPIAAIAQLLNSGHGIPQLFLFRDDDIDLDVACCRDRFFHLRPSGCVAANHFTQHHVTDGKAERGQRNGVVAKLCHQLIISAAPGDRSEFAGAIKDLKNNSSIISQAADNADIDPGEISEDDVNDLQVDDEDKSVRIRIPSTPQGLR